MLMIFPCVDATRDPGDSSVSMLTSNCVCLIVLSWCQLRFVAIVVIDVLHLPNITAILLLPSDLRQINLMHANAACCLRPCTRRDDETGLGLCM